MKAITPRGDGFPVTHTPPSDTEKLFVSQRTSTGPYGLGQRYDRL